MDQTSPVTGPTAGDEPQAEGTRMDRSFQRRYAGMLVLLVIMVGAPLGVLLFRQVDEAMRVADAALGASQAASRAEKVALDRARHRLRRAEAERPAPLDPALGDATRSGAAAVAEGLDARARALDATAAQLRRHRADLADRRATIRFSLGLGLAVLLLLLAGFGILVTHRVLQPIAWIRRRIAAVRAGRRDAPEPLEPGHPLRSLQVEFQAMVDALRRPEPEPVRPEPGQPT